MRQIIFQRYKCIIAIILMILIIINISLINDLIIGEEDSELDNSNVNSVSNSQNAVNKEVSRTRARPTDLDPLIKIETNYGNITIVLYEDEAPITVENFLKYINDTFYDGLIFHRVIDGFMIQAGGFYPDMTPKNAICPPIQLEIDPELRHGDGAIAMARMGSSSDPEDPEGHNTATSQFYICDGSQPFLDDNYAVFGQVTVGMEVVRNISAVATTSKGHYNNVPVDNVIINKAIADLDSDGDGIRDSIDAFPLDPEKWSIIESGSEKVSSGFLPGFDLIILLFAFGIILIINNRCFKTR